MLNLILTLVFSIVMLVFMAFPAMKIVEGIEKFMPLSDKWRNIMVVLVTILLSLLIGLFLRFA
ncbi:MAG: hypothetical protein FAF03_00950 [Epsilonproteobacteria bacterium]|nr:hypothetical protein [Campylobacterota bacterium]